MSEENFNEVFSRIMKDKIVKTHLIPWGTVFIVLKVWGTVLAGWSWWWLLLPTFPSIWAILHQLRMVA